MTDRLDRWTDPPLLVLASLADEPSTVMPSPRTWREPWACGSARDAVRVIARLEARGLIDPLELDDRFAVSHHDAGARHWRSSPSG